MKLLFYTESAKFGGAEIYLLKIVEYAQQCGHSVTVVAPPENQELWSQLQGIDVSIEAASVHQKDRHQRRRQVYAILATITADLLHINLHWSLRCSGAMLAATDLGIPYVLTFHTPMPPKALSLPTRWRFRRLFRGAVARLTVSRDNKLNHCAFFGLKDSEVQVIRNGVRCSTFTEAQQERMTIRRELGISENVPTVVFVGRLSAEKGCHRLLDIVRRVSADIRFLVVGSGPLETELLERIHREGLENRVQMLGFRKDIPAILAAADLLVLPSDYESTAPFALMEAMAAGKPIVASRVFGIHQAITEGVEGYVHDPGDLDGFARSISTLASDTSLRESMGRAAAKRARASFSESQMLDQTFNVFNRAAER